MYTKQQKTAYFKGLRLEWQDRKKQADADPDAKKRYEAVIREANGKFSYMSFYFTLVDMRANGMDGNPYIDAKTLAKWRENGFKVRKGEKSKIRGIVWLHPRTKDKNGQYIEDENSPFLYPKVYHLFHRTQVDPL